MGDNDGGDQESRRTGKWLNTWIWKFDGAHRPYSHLGGTKVAHTSYFSLKKMVELMKKLKHCIYVEIFSLFSPHLKEPTLPILFLLLQCQHLLPQRSW